jgi:hypothetical protein
MEMQVLCGRIVREGKRNDNVYDGKTLLPADRSRTKEGIGNEGNDVEIAKTWLYLGSANLSLSAWYVDLFPLI